MSLILHNHLSSNSLPLNITPIQNAFSFVPEISKFLQFHWWQPVLYKSDTKTFPSSTYKGLGRFVGVATNIGDLLTYYVLTNDTQQVIAFSYVRTLNPDNLNLCILQPTSNGRMMMMTMLLSL